MHAGAHLATAIATIPPMIETRYPNRWFGSNPQALTGNGKQLHAFSRDVPKDWRSALGVSGDNASDPARTSEAETTE